MASRQRRGNYYNSSSSSTARRDAVSVSAANRSRSLTAMSQLAGGGIITRNVILSDGAVRPNDGTLSFQAGYEAVFDCDPPGLDSRYTCPVCLAALRQPIQTKCGHRFCSSCFRNSIAGQRNAKCPVDKTILTSVNRDVFSDLAMEREVLSLPVKCDNCIIGCEWRGELRALDDHLRSCEDAAVFCSNVGCPAVYKRAEHQVHQHECSMRIQTCTHCGSAMLSSELAKHQLLTCSRFPVTCGQCGELGIVREDISRHSDPETGTCPMSIVNCPFATLGCTFQDVRKNMTAHVQSQSGVWQHLNSIRTCLGRLEQGSSQHHRHQQLQPVQSVNAATDNNNVDGGASFGVRDSIPRDGRLLWKISLVLDSPVQAPPSASASYVLTPRSYRSPSFYTANIGYKVHLVFEIHASRDQQLSSDGVQFDTPAPSVRSTGYTRRLSEPHCSIFIRLEPGRFDDSLRFPLDGSLTATLINQADNPDDRVNHKASIVFHDLPRVFLSHDHRSEDSSPIGNEVAASSSETVRADATVTTAEYDSQRRGRLRLISLRRLSSCPFVRNSELFVQAEVSHLLPFPTAISAPVV